MKISYVNPLCLKNDGISGSIRDEIFSLQKTGQHDICLFGYTCEYSSIPFIKTTTVQDIVFNPFYQTSDLIVFHFGIFYNLFDAILLSPRNAKRLVVFHNVTPKQFVAEKDHSLIDRSFHQMANITWADHVICISETNLSVLHEAGIRTSATVIPLAVHSNLHAPANKPCMQDNIVRLVFLGRLVKSKGPEDLLVAVQKALHQVPQERLQLDIISNIQGSDSELVTKLQKTIKEIHATFGNRIKITIYPNATEETKQKILRDADMFVLPTYHEGFCVPIVESLASGCKVITYDNSNTPAVSGGHAALVPTGDINALSAALQEAITQVCSTAWRGKGADSYTEYAKTTQAYVKQFSPAQVEQKFLQVIESL
jgi:glycosyltransferase involved in cell wall biosynthesis